MAAKITLLDGTHEPRWGKILEEALIEFSRHHPVKVSPKPGSYDPEGFDIVEKAEKESYNRDRGQVNVYKFMEIAGDMIGGTRSPTKIFLTGKDIYRPGLNFGYGSTAGVETHGKMENYIVISINRMKTEAQFKDLVLHELGHIYGAAKDGRINTDRNLGSHCTNDLCVMQQKDNMPDAEAYTARRKRSNADAYCSQCSKEIKSHRGD